MRAKHRSRRSKGGGLRNKAVQLKMSLRMGFLFVILGALVIVNGLFIFSLISKISTSERGVSGDETAFSEGIVRGDQTIRVEVLNGAGVGGIARRMTDFLRRKGFDVIDFGNAKSFNYHETVVLHRGEDRTAGQLVAQAIRTTNIVDQKNPFLTLDVTLILGRDYRKLLPFTSERREE